MTVIGACKAEDCLLGGVVHTHEAAVYPIRGYETTRSGGGQNHVLRKQRVDGWVWHKQCFDQVMRRKDGGAEQEPLIP
jgi:hypothetical protein